jgi:peptidoglycan/xylan/chitin deacetylase (PgdA/CDA1 family)
MNAGQIRELHLQGFSYHSHTRSHRDLTILSAGELREELEGSRRELEILVESPVAYLAYPFGRYNDLVIEAARAAGYRAAFSVLPGFNRLGIDPYRIRRLDVFGSDSVAMLMRKIHLGSNDGSLGAVLRYYGSRLAKRSWLRAGSLFR